MITITPPEDKISIDNNSSMITCVLVIPFEKKKFHWIWSAVHWCCCDQNWELWWYQIHTTLHTTSYLPQHYYYSWLMTSNVTILVEEKTCFASFYTLVLTPTLANMLSLSTLAVYQVSQGSLHTGATYLCIVPTYQTSRHLLGPIHLFELV